MPPHCSMQMNYTCTAPACIGPTQPGPHVRPTAATSIGPAPLVALALPHCAAHAAHASYAALRQGLNCIRSHQQFISRSKEGRAGRARAVPPPQSPKHNLQPDPVQTQTHAASRSSSHRHILELHGRLAQLVAQASHAVQEGLCVRMHAAYAGRRRACVAAATGDLHAHVHARTHMLVKQQGVDSRTAACYVLAHGRKSGQRRAPHPPNACHWRAGVDSKWPNSGPAARRGSCRWPTRCRRAP